MTTLAVPLSLLQFPGYFTNNLGQPLAGGLLYFVEAGLTTPLATYADCNGTSANTNPLVLDAYGRCTVFLLPELYDIDVHDASDVSLYTRLGVGNPGQIFAAAYGNVQTQGSKSVASGYSILVTDNLVSYVSSSAGTVNLPAASVRSSANAGNGLPLILCNFGSSTLGAVPNGGDLINRVNSTLTLAAGKTAIFYSDAVSSWYAVVSG